MTALQWIIKEEKIIRKKSPKMEWKKAVAQASAIYASKHKGKSPVGKKKKSATKKKKTVKKKIAAKKKVVKKRIVSGVKKKKISEQSILNRIHKVKDSVSKLDEAQHKHMMGAINKHTIEKLNKSIDNVMKYEFLINSINNKLKNKSKYSSLIINDLKKTKKSYIMLLREEKKHISELKKHIK